MADVIVGIDLGTTNSEVAALVDGKVQVLAAGGEQIMPSFVGLSPEGTPLVGTPARNQYVIYPERTVKSIKRLMGSGERVTMGEQTYSPPEISAMILRALKARAEAVLGGPVRRAVITVPAYFSDAQRQATRDAGEIAGLEVVRILNEPTAAALAYGSDRVGDRTVLVYDLGGGTFDVSLVQVSGEVTEVLASLGNNRLGGDDFDQLLLDLVLARFVATGGPDVRGDRRAMSRLLRAAEEAKKRLSFEPYTRLAEEHLAARDGVSLHLDLEVSREEYERLIRHLVESTLDSVHRALADAGKRPDEVNDILLVGGATRTPLVSELLREKTGLVPRQEVHPDLCVALGAGVSPPGWPATTSTASSSTSPPTRSGPRTSGSSTAVRPSTATARSSPATRRSPPAGPTPIARWSTTRRPGRSASTRGTIPTRSTTSWSAAS